MHQRYATPAMAEVWSETTRNTIERQIWLDVMIAQQRMGVPIPDQALADYQSAAQDIPEYGDVELREIAQIEARTRHDLVARLQYFNTVAGWDLAHQGLTSADIVENAQQVQIVRAAQVLVASADQLMLRLLEQARTLAEIPMVARTHGVPAQLITVGKRFADWAVELSNAVGNLDTVVESYFPRGIKGAVGTRGDMAALLARYAPEGVSGMDLAVQLDELIFHLDTSEVGPVALPTCGQIYPRSFDLPIVAAALALATVCDTIATNIRLWAVLDHGQELRDPGQLGSSAMPHKSNPRYSERVHSLTVAARGYTSMVNELAGAQWFEGDVSSSAARRIALPGLFQSVDAALANTAFALDRLHLDRGAILVDVRQHLPLLASGLILQACVDAGADRTVAHARIAEHARHHDGAFRWVNPMDWVLRIGEDEALPLTADQVMELADVQRLSAAAAEIAHATAQGMDLDLGELDPDWPGDLI